MSLNKSFGAGSDIGAGIYADAVREWVPVKNSDSHVMLLNNGFAVRAPGKMYAKVEVPSQLISDLGFIPGYNIDEGGVEIEYSSWQSKIAFKTRKGTYILDGKENPELYGGIKDFLLEDNVLLGTAGGMSVDMSKVQSSEHGTLYKAVAVVTTLGLLAFNSGCLGSGGETTVKQKATEKTSTEQYSGAPTPAGTPADAAQSGINVPWLIEKKGIMSGKYYEIDRGQLPVDANGWKAVFEDNKFNDNVIDPDDGVAEMAGGILGDKAIIIVDEDVFKLHGGDFGVKPKGENAFGVGKGDVKEIAPGIYYYEWDLKVKGGVGASVSYPLGESASVPGEENGFGAVAFKKQ